MRGRQFLVILVAATAIDVLIPYLLIGSVASFAASFLFWCVVPLAVIVFAYIATGSWGKTS